MRKNIKNVYFACPGTSKYWSRGKRFCWSLLKIYYVKLQGTIINDSNSNSIAVLKKNGKLYVLPDFSLSSNTAVLKQVFLCAQSLNLSQNQ